MHKSIVFFLIIFLCFGVVLGETPDLPERVGVFPQEVRKFYTNDNGLPDDDVRGIAIDRAGSVVARMPNGDYLLRDGKWLATSNTSALDSKRKCPPELRDLVKSSVSSVARHTSRAVAVGTEHGLYLSDNAGQRQLFPSQGSRRWAPTHVSVAFDGNGRLWFASRQGAGCLFDGEWSLYTGADGLPYDDLTSVDCTESGTVWFGTTMGAIRFDGRRWSYRQGKRWLPHDEVRDVAVDAEGRAWIATAGGISCIYFQEMSLAQKAEHYEDEIDAHHRRTEFGYVIEAHTSVPGEKSDVRLSDSDNDGLWTSMYGAGECFAYGATKDPLAKRRAQAAFEALRFLSEVPKGSKHSPPAGFIARTVLETSSDRDPNSSFTLEDQRRKQKSDGLWRVYEPRWPKSADEKYYWKSDTSSDELDGHYFFYPLYYDLVAESESEKPRVREIVRANIDHLIDHDFSLHDHAGKTRWGVYGPKDLNHDPEWFVERGLKSLSMLSYLNVAYHLTGDDKYREVAAELRDKHSYHINVMWPKYQRGIGSGNHSDDEMAFMSFYNLIKYEPDPKLRKLYVASFANSWRQEEPEMNPFFNFCFAAVATDVRFKNIWGTFDMSPWPTWLADSIETLKRFSARSFQLATHESPSERHRDAVRSLSRRFSAAESRAGVSRRRQSHSR